MTFILIDEDNNDEPLASGGGMLAILNARARYPVLDRFIKNGGADQKLKDEIIATELPRHLTYIKGILKQLNGAVYISDFVQDSTQRRRKKTR